MVLELLISELLGFLLVAGLAGGCLGYLIGVSGLATRQRIRLEHRYINLLREYRKVQQRLAVHTRSTAELDGRTPVVTQRTNDSLAEYWRQLEELRAENDALQLGLSGDVHVFKQEARPEQEWYADEGEHLVEVYPLATLHEEPTPSITDEEIADVIRTRAYQLWLQQGQPTGCSAAHWAQAEQEILSIRSGESL